MVLGNRQGAGPKATLMLNTFWPDGRGVALTLMVQPAHATLEPTDMYNALDALRPEFQDPARRSGATPALWTACSRQRRARSTPTPWPPPSPEHFRYGARPENHPFAARRLDHRPVVSSVHFVNKIC